jgi:hypothetical protein
MLAEWDGTQYTGMCGLVAKYCKCKILHSVCLKLIDIACSKMDFWFTAGSFNPIPRADRMIIVAIFQDTSLSGLILIIQRIFQRWV